MRMFGNKRSVRDKESGVIVGEIASPVKARTRDTLDGSFGAERGRYLIVSLEAGDLICLKTCKSRANRTFRIAASDVYRWAINVEARRLARDKAMKKRERKAQKNADARQRNAEKKLTAPYEV